MFTLSINDQICARRTVVAGVKTAARKHFATLTLEGRKDCVFKIYQGSGVAQHELVLVAENHNSWRLRWRRARASDSIQKVDPPGKLTEVA